MWNFNASKFRQRSFWRTSVDVSNIAKHMWFIYVHILSLQKLMFGRGCLHILDPTDDWWMDILKSWVVVGSASGKNGYTSLKWGMPFCCDVKWHYPKDVWHDFVKVRTMICMGGGISKSLGNLLGLQFTATKENITAGEQTQPKVIKSQLLTKQMSNVLVFLATSTSVSHREPHSSPNLLCLPS